MALCQAKGLPNQFPPAVNTNHSPPPHRYLRHVEAAATANIDADATRSAFFHVRHHLLKEGARLPAATNSHVVNLTHVGKGVEWCLHYIPEA